MPRNRKKDVLQELLLSEIRPSPANARKSFDKVKHEELVASIRAVGLLQPIVVRRMPQNGTKFEIVYGERRYRAIKAIAQDQGTAPVITAIIRDLDDDEAFIANVVENLQREDVSELEEARAFAAFANRCGEDAVEILSERVGASRKYVRKRIEVTRLPKSLLWAWEKELVCYGHLEQFLRMAGKKEQLLYFKRIYKQRDGWQPITVQMMREEINNSALSLTAAHFETEACKACLKNTASQMRLFGTGLEEARCTNPKCFTEKQVEWLNANWVASDLNRDKTNGYVLNGSKVPTTYMRGHESVPEKCVECENLVSMIHISGLVQSGKICKSATSCYLDILNARATAKGERVETPKEKPRVEWHGEFFRQEFYKEQIPARIKELNGDGDARLAFFALMHSNFEVQTWFKETHGTSEFTTRENGGVFEYLANFDADQLRVITFDALQHLIFTDRSFCDRDRRDIADYLGVDLSDWKITREYLQKKRKAEILQIITDHGFMRDQMFLRKMSKTHKMSLQESLATLKKSELIELIMDSGADLCGKIPREISEFSSVQPARTWEPTSPEMAGEEDDPKCGCEEESACEREQDDEAGE